MTRITMNRALALTAASAVALGSLALAAPASAKDGDVKMRGTCSAATDWVVKVKPKKGQLRADFWVKNTAPAGQAWTLAVTRGSTTLSTSTTATRATDDDGSDDTRYTAEAKWRTWTSPGALTFTATGPNGETCTASIG